MTDRQIEAIEKLGWLVKEFDDYWQLENWSPAGEDLPLEISKGEDVVKQLEENAENFDPDENVELWIESSGKNGIPATARELVDDADKIKKMYEELAKVVKEVTKGESNGSSRHQN